MITWFKRLLYDESAFERYVRSIICGLGIAAQHGIIPAGKFGFYAGIIAQAAALMIPAGDKNPQGKTS